MSLYYVTCLDDGSVYGYMASSPMESLQKHQYSLDLAGKDEDARINLGGHCEFLYLTHRGKTYAVRNQVLWP